MAGIYSSYKKLAMDGALNLGSAAIKVVLIDDADYTPNFATDANLADVPAGARVGTPTLLASKTTTAGVFDAADTVMSSVTGDQCESALVFYDTGNTSTSSLVCLLALGSAVTPNGGDITIVWDNGANKIFKF